MTESERLARLEAELGELRAEVERLRDELRAERAPAPTPGPTPGPVRPRPVPIPGLAREGLRARARRSAASLVEGVEVESLVGRYGTVALATLTILIGVGTFLTWVATQFTLTPGARVVLGLVAAAGVGAMGWRLRQRPGGGAFGNVLLALALAIVHVDAWGAGPYLGLVSPAVALGVAGAASAALALLAWRSGEEALFVVGTGGALVAPFVTSAGPGRPFVLAVYGWLVLTMGALAVRRGRAEHGAAKPWVIAARLLSVGCSLYVAAMLPDVTGATASASADVTGASSVWLRRDLPAVFAIACAIGALALAGARHRREITLADVTAALVALVAIVLASDAHAPRLPVTALAATLLAYAALRGRALPGDDAAAGRPRVDVSPWAAVTLALPVALPLGLLAVALGALRDAFSPSGALHAAGWAALAAVAAWDAARDAEGADGGDGAASRAAPHLAALGLASAMVPILVLEDRPTACVVALAAHAAIFALLYGRVRRAIVLLPVLAVLAVASGWSFALLQERPAFAYTPFVTSASLAAAATVAAWCIASWRVWRAPHEAPLDADAGARVQRHPERALLLAGGPVAALLWGREELSRAFSPDTATFLLIAYFAATGVASIFVGRARQLAGARQAGLALAIFAAVKALAQASALESVGLKVGSVLVVGGFLLAVAYWYRAAGAATAREAAPTA
jgi:hypothetical protein